VQKDETEEFETSEDTVVEDIEEESDAEKDIKAKTIEIANLKETLLRSLADQENSRRRFAKEKEDTHKYAITSFAKDLLGILDALDKAIESVAEGESGSFVDGILMTRDIFKSVFEKYNIRKIETDGKFDPSFHQVLCEIESDQAQGIIVSVMQEGYTIGDRILRPSLVTVSKGK
jgi:molecular chaperone GrpE